MKKQRDSKVAMTIRIGSIWARALAVIAESRGWTIEQTIEEMIRDAALDHTAQQHKGRLIRLTDHTKADDDSGQLT